MHQENSALSRILLVPYSYYSQLQIMLHSMVIYLVMSDYIELVGSLHTQVTEIRIHVCKTKVCS